MLSYHMGGKRDDLINVCLKSSGDQFLSFSQVYLKIFSKAFHYLVFKELFSVSPVL